MQRQHKLFKAQKGMSQPLLLPAGQYLTFEELEARFCWTFWDRREWLANIDLEEVPFDVISSTVYGKSRIEAAWAKKSAFVRRTVELKAIQHLYLTKGLET